MTDLNAQRLLLVGCGKMGRALLEGWLARGLAVDDVRVIDPHAAALPPGVASVSGPDALGAWRPTVVVLAVKPQVMAEVTAAYAPLTTESLFLSIAAGRTLASFARGLGDGAAVIRAMPNTPAAVGRGMTVACANSRVDAAARALAQTLLEAVGEVAWVEDEALMDPVTAVSGSGPAYVFWLVECLAAAGAQAGLPEDLAMRLARATVAGAGELLHRSPESAATLRESVTSPKGTTAAALEVLMGEDGIKEPLARAVAAASRRSRELAQ